MKNILVTGTAGFIGFHVAKRLLGDGYRVTGLDCINDYYDTGLKYARLRILGIPDDGIRDGVPVASGAGRGALFDRQSLGLHRKQHHGAPQHSRSLPAFSRGASCLCFQFVGLRIE